MVDVGHKRIFAEVEFAHEMWIVILLNFYRNKIFSSARPVEPNTEHPVLSESPDKQINVSAARLAILGQSSLL